MLSKNEPALQLQLHLPSPFCISGDVMVNRNKKKIKLQQKNTQNSNIQNIQFMHIPVKM